MSLGIFSVSPPAEPCALRSTQPLKVSTRNFSWGKGGRCVWLTTYRPCSAETSRKSGALTYPEPLAPPRPVAGHLYFFLLITQVNNRLQHAACSSKTGRHKFFGVGGFLIHKIQADTGFYQNCQNDFPHCKT